MPDSTRVVLIDGVGHPRITEYIDPPDVIEALSDFVFSGPGSRVNFVRQPDALLNGMAVFRQEDKGFPPIRLIYIREEMVPFNPPRAESV